MCFGVWFHEIQYDGFNSASHGPQQKNSDLWGTIRFVTHYVSILALHIEILCAVRTKYYALGARNDIRTVPV